MQMSSETAATSSAFLEMLNEIVTNDQKQQQDGFVDIAPIAFWTKTFAKYFLHANNPHHDDLLFYVQKADEADSAGEVEVFRRESNKSPGLGDPNYDWTETLYLNLILQQLEYTLSCAICTKHSNSKLDVVIHKKVSKQVYASPSRHSMDEKGKGAELCYPNIFFTVDSFDEIWNELYLDENRIVCVEIVATDKTKRFGSVIFLGSVTHAALLDVYNKRTHNANKWTQVMTLGLGKNPYNVEFVRMKGPNGKGYAEMAIRKCEKEEIDTINNSQCTCGSVGTSAFKACPQHPYTLAKSDPSLYDGSMKTDAKKESKPHRSKFFKESMLKKLAKQTNPQDASQSLPTSPTVEHVTSDVLKAHLTYVSLPWHSIILDVLQSFEKPAAAKRPVLHKFPRNR